jgi:DNA-binding NarL/FixJ family response regulator
MLGVTLRVLGLVEGGAEGLRLLEESAATLAGSQARLEHAKSLVELGAALRRANHRADARDHLREGLDLAHRLGAAALREQAKLELAATGARPRRLELTGLDALTPSERRVAELAASELTNREIAQTLFVTPKTVEVHLSSAYRKLGIGSRTQLAEAIGSVQGST